MSAQALPEVPHDGFIDVPASNAAQRRGAHGLFRYFGKLAPDVTKKVLELTIEELPENRGDALVVDVMCGSGTTLLEANELGFPAIGVDCNPVAVLYARAKTTPVDIEAYRAALATVQASYKPARRAAVEAVFGRMRNFDRWFRADVAAALVGLRRAISDLPESAERQLLLALLVSRARKASNASERTGRIFYAPDTAPANAAEDFFAAAFNAESAIPHITTASEIREGDARKLPVDASSASIAFCHPPYFALYRYSSDVLRFELALGGFDLKPITQQEIAEGWKSGDPSNLDLYIADMGSVLGEMRRVVSLAGLAAVVASNSTLGDHQLPVVDRLVEAGESNGFRLHRHYVRRAHFGSATYHRSARTDKVINQDHVLLFAPI